MDEKWISICCITYNQEKYIIDAIESFLRQTIIGHCEILIHDDASQDNTVNIIKSYVEKYPNLIKFYGESKNQYQQGKQPMQKLFEQAKGKYIALCEGDDYWIDPYKLEKQFDFMEIHKQYSMCFHASKIYNQKIKQFLKSQHAYPNDCKSNIKDIIIKDGGFVPTASIFCRTDIVKRIPKFYYNYTIGDYSLQVILAANGEVYYMDEEMSVYRRYTENSLVCEFYSNKKNEIMMYRSMSNMLHDFSEYSNGKYDKIVEYKRDYYEYKILETKNQLFKILMSPYRKFLFKQPIKQMIKTILKCIFSYCHISL
ncbi:MAG: glycosyltransferase [Lachnospiraceae bacterium]|nr:glycosyltransferase [Lachnospiraceae bacterium]